MKVKSFFLSAALVAAVTTTSCTNDEITDNAPAAVKFTSAVAGQNAEFVTKAAGTAWAAGDAIGIYMVAAGTTTVSEGAENRKYTTAGGTAFSYATAADAIYYPVNGNKVDFIAYYPQTAITGFVYNVNVASQTSQAAIDLLYSNNAVNKDKTTTNVALTFNHKLVKLILNTTAGAGLQASDLTGMSVKIKGMNTKNTFDLKTGALGASPNTPAAITPYTATNGAKYEAVVLPRTVAALGDVSVEFTVGTDTFVWKVPAATSFAAGSEYTYDITITRTGVSVTGTINPWTQVPGGTGTAE